MIARAAMAALMLTACADGDPAGAPTPSTAATSASLTASPTPSATVVTTPTVTPATGEDLDGDGRADRASVVESTDDRLSPKWRWGLRVALTSGGPQTLWRDYGSESNEGQSVAGIADVGGDGAAEVIVQPGSTATSAFFLVATLLDGRLVWATKGGEEFYLEAAEVPAVRGFDCADVVPDHPGPELVDVTVRKRGATMRGTRVAYRLDGGEVTQLRTDTATWPATAPAPAGYTTGQCGIAG